MTVNFNSELIEYLQLNHIIKNLNKASTDTATNENFKQINAIKRYSMPGKLEILKEKSVNSMNNFSVNNIFTEIKNFNETKWVFLLNF